MPKLTIEIDAENQASDELTAVEQDLKGVSESAEDSANANQKAGLSFTELNSAVSLVKQGLQVAQQVYEATAGKTLALAASQRELGLAGQISAEEAGTLIQVADDLGIEAGTLTNAFREMVKDGLQPTFANIRNVAAGYQAIQDPTERLQFAQKSLGRAYQDLLPMLEKTPAELDRMAESARASGLVLSNESVAGARQFEIALDDLQDSTDAMAVAAGEGMLPVLTDLTNFTTESVLPAVGQFTEFLGKGIEAGKQYAGIYELLFIKGQLATGQIDQETASMRAWLVANRDNIDSRGVLTTSTNVHAISVQGVTTATEANTTATDENTTATELAKDATQRANDTLSILKLNMAGAVGNEMESFKIKQEELRTKADEYRAKIDELNGKVYLTPAQSDELVATQGLYADTTAKIEENATKHEEATRRILFGIVEQRLAMGGMTEEESGFLVTLATKWGLVDQATADATRTIIDGIGDAEATGNWEALYDRLGGAAARLNGGPGSVTATANDARSALLGIPTWIGIEVHTNYTSSGSPAAGEVGIGPEGPGPAPGPNGSPPTSGAYQHGTSGWLTVPPGYNENYTIGMSSGERYAVVPPGQGAPAGPVININNPVIASEMDITLLAQRVVREIQRRT